MEIEDRRGASRIEPSKAKVKVMITDRKKQIEGHILDFSQSGMSISVISNKEHDINIDSNVSIMYIGENEEIDIGNAQVVRIWDTNDFFGREIGFAVKLFEDYLTNNVPLIGNNQRTRLEGQKIIATNDFQYLTEYRKHLSECQMKLFELTLLVSVSIASIFFSILYSSAINNLVPNPGVLFWRSMLASLPGIFSLICCLLFIQKSISIQRVDAYMSIINECTYINQFPREYKGWENASRKIRHVLNTQLCNNCECSKGRLCGIFDGTDLIKIRKKGFIKNPENDLYYILTLLIFMSLIILSIVALIHSITMYTININQYMIISSLMTLILSGSILYIVYNLYHLRKGKYSSLKFRRSWLDILSRCQIVN